MKKFLKALSVIAAVLALGFGFTACSDSSSDGNDGEAGGGGA